MNLADQLKANIEFNNAVQKLQREIVKGNESVLINASESVLNRLREEGFHVNTDGFQFNGGAYVSLKPTSQWGDH
jgi:DNA-directed RNA polymerase beta' subunit